MASSPDSSPLLLASGLRKRFGLTVALDGASLTARAGEVVAIRGPSGSGKSTLLLTLAGILQPEQGSVHYRGVDICRLSDERRTRLRRTDFGFVFQSGHLVPELPAFENVALPLRLQGVRRRKAESSAKEFLDRLGVGDVADRRPGEMSGGQAQRVAIARALITNPVLVFADEPTGSLDSENAESVMRLLTTTARGQYATVLVVTHEATVAAHADREVLVRDGRVAESSQRL